MTVENLKKHHERLKWLASGEFNERDFDYKIAASKNPNGQKGELGWFQMGEMSPKRRQLIQQDAQRTLELFEKKYPGFKEEPKVEPVSKPKPISKPKEKE